MVPADRPAGKRQVRPNLSRNSDFGYTERPRVPIQKVPKKPKRTEEDEEAGGASARLEKDASRSLVRGAPRYCAALRDHEENLVGTGRGHGRGYI